VSFQVNKNVKYLRKARGFTQDSFAIALGVKRALIGSYEENRALIRTDLLPVIAKLLSINVNRLLNEDLTIGPAPAPEFQASTAPPPVYNPAPEPNFEPLVITQIPFVPQSTNTPAPEYTPVSNPAVAISSENSNSKGLLIEDSYSEQNKETIETPKQQVPSKPKVADEPRKVDRSYLVGEQVRIQTVMLDADGKPLVSLVAHAQIAQYLKQFQQTKWLSDLPIMSYPAANPYTVYRAFELEKNGVYYIGSYERNWLALSLGKRYIVLNTAGLQLGTIDALPTVDEPLVMVVNGKTIHIPANEILEIWQVAAVLNTAQNSDTDTKIDRLAQLLDSLQGELAALKATQ